MNKNILVSIFSLILIIFSVDYIEATYIDNSNSISLEEDIQYTVENHLETLVILDYQNNIVTTDFLNLASEYIKDKDYKSIINILILNNWHYLYQIYNKQDLELNNNSYYPLSNTFLRSQNTIITYPFRLDLDYDNNGVIDTAYVRFSHTGKFYYNSSNYNVVSVPQQHSTTLVTVHGIPLNSTIESEYKSVSCDYSQHSNYVRFYGNIDYLVGKLFVGDFFTGATFSIIVFSNPNMSNIIQ